MRSGGELPGCATFILFEMRGAGDCRDMLIAGELGEADNGEANRGHAAGPCA